MAHTDTGTIGRRVRALTIVLAAGAACGIANAGPDGAQVVHGQASIATDGARTTITAGHNAIINYRSFDIGAHESVRFVQPSADARVLNRIQSASPTRIDGSLTANGRVYLVNPSGVLFGRDAVVNVGAMYAAAANLSNESFLSGIDRFTDARGAVVNYGSITARDVALVGGTVANHGTIRAERGTVVYAAGDEVFIGDALGTFSVRTTAPETPKASPDPLGLTGLAAGDVVSLAAWHTGSTSADRVRVEASGDASVQGRVTAGSAFDARSDRLALSGATVAVADGVVRASANDHLVLAGSTIDARAVSYTAGRDLESTPVFLSSPLTPEAAVTTVTAENIEIAGGASGGAPMPGGGGAGTMTIFEADLEADTGDVTLTAENRIFTSGTFDNNLVADGGQFLTLSDDRNVTLSTRNSLGAADTLEGIELGPRDGFEGVRLSGAGAFSATAGTAADAGPAPLTLAAVRTVNGDITLVSAGVATLGGDLESAGGSIDITGSTIRTSASLVSSGGNLAFNSPVQVESDLAVFGTGDVGSTAVFGGTIDTASDFSTTDNAPTFAVTAPNYAVTFGDRVGDARRLGTFQIEGSSIAAAGVLTQGDQSYTGAVTFDGGLFNVDGNQPGTPGELPLGGGLSVNGALMLTGNTAISTTAVPPDGAAPFEIVLSGDVTSDATPRVLIIDATDQSVRLLGDIGSGGPIASLALGGGAATVASVTTTGSQEYLTPSLSLTGPLLASTGSGTINITGDITLLDNASIAASSAAGSDVTIGGGVDGPHAFLISALNGDVSIAGDIGATATVSSVAIGGNALSLAGVTTTGVQEYLATTETRVNDATLRSLDGGSISFTGPLAATGSAVVTTAGPVSIGGGLTGDAFNIVGSSVSVGGDSDAMSLAVNAQSAFTSTGTLALTGMGAGVLDIDAPTIALTGGASVANGDASLTTDGLSAGAPVTGLSFAVIPMTAGADILLGAAPATATGLAISPDTLANLTPGTLVFGQPGAAGTLRVFSNLDLGATGFLANLAAEFGSADGSAIPMLTSTGPLTFNGAVGVSSGITSGTLVLGGSAITFVNGVSAPRLHVDAGTTTLTGDAAATSGLTFTGHLVIAGTGTTTVSGGTSRSVFGGNVFAADGVVSDLIVLTDPGFATGTSLGEESSLFFGGSVGVNPATPTLGTFRSVVLGPATGGPGAGEAAFAKVVFTSSALPGSPRTMGQTFTIAATDRVATGDGTRLLADGNLVITAGGSGTDGVIRLTDATALGDLTVTSLAADGVSPSLIELVAKPIVQTHTAETYAASLSGMFTSAPLDFGTDLLASGAVSVTGNTTNVVPGGDPNSAIVPFVGAGGSVDTGDFNQPGGTTLLPIDGTLPRAVTSVAASQGGSSLAQALPTDARVPVVSFTRTDTPPDERDLPDFVADQQVLAELGFAPPREGPRADPFRPTRVRDSAGGIGGFASAAELDSAAMATVVDAYVALFGESPADRRATTTRIRDAIAEAAQDGDADLRTALDTGEAAEAAEFFRLVSEVGLGDNAREQILRSIAARITPAGVDPQAVIDAFLPQAEEATASADAPRDFKEDA